VRSGCPKRRSEDEGKKSCACPHSVLDGTWSQHDRVKEDWRKGRGEEESDDSSKLNAHNDVETLLPKQIKKEKKGPLKKKVTVPVIYTQGPSGIIYCSKKEIPLFKDEERQVESIEKYLEPVKFGEG